MRDGDGVGGAVDARDYEERPRRRRPPCAEEVADAAASLARLRWALARSGLTRVGAERAAGFAPGALGHLLSGRRGVRTGTWRAGRLAAALRVRAAWLILGDGPAWWEVTRSQGDRLRTLEVDPGGAPFTSWGGRAKAWRGLGGRRDAVEVARLVGGRLVAIAARLPAECRPRLEAGSGHDGPDAAAEIARRHGMIVGAHHKQWVIDQMLRAVLGPDGYAAWVKGMNSDSDRAPWDEGVSP